MTDRALLVPFARAAIADGLGLQDPSAPSLTDAPKLFPEPGASFVTLTIGGMLRGCIGSLVAHRSLGDDVVSNARSAAFRDPRFFAVTREEFPHLEIEVSVLSAPEPLKYENRADLLAKLRPGVDGLVLSYGGRHGTFLPQVWRQLPDPDDFLKQLVHKAHLPEDFWSDQIEIERYTVTEYR